jgi:hypothetical protein
MTAEAQRLWQAFTPRMGARSGVRGTRQKRRKILLNYGDNTSNDNHRHHHGSIHAERRTAQNGSKLPAPNKLGLYAMEGGAESKETAPVRRWRYF